jgi:hypothetical protein
MTIPRRRCFTLPARGITRRLDKESAVRVIVETSGHRIAFDEWVNGAGRLRMRTQDTQHAVWERRFPISFEQLNLLPSAPQRGGRGAFAAPVRKGPCIAGALRPERRHAGHQ